MDINSGSSSFFKFNNLNPAQKLNAFQLAIILFMGFILWNNNDSKDEVIKYWKDIANERSLEGKEKDKEIKYLLKSKDSMYRFKFGKSDEYIESNRELIQSKIKHK